MTEKRFRVHELVKYDYSEISEYVGEGYTDKPLRNDEIVALLNEFEDLKIQYNNLKMQRDEFYHGARENANRVKQLKKENEELKDKNSQLQETLAFRSNQLALMERLVDDLGSEEMVRQMEEILND